MSFETAQAPAQMPEAAGPPLQYVGFWARVLAALIDTAMLFIITLPIGYLVYGGLAGSDDSVIRGPADLLVNWVLPTALVLWLWHRLQATPGKMALSARIVDADNGKAPTFTQFLIRYVGYFVSVIPFGLGLVWVGLDRRKQGWHDKMANTVVVRPAPAGAVRLAGTS